MTSITKIEGVRYDEYTGTIDDLIAAGLLRRDQLPPEGRAAISWSNGVQKSRNVRRDEHYLRVTLKPRGRATLWVGVSAEVSAPRAVAAREAWEARLQEEEQARKRQAEANERMEKAERAKRNLASTLRMNSEKKFRMRLADGLRRSVKFETDYASEVATWHGYRITAEGADAILIATDALVEAIMQADVIFDGELHEKIIAGFRAQARAADPSFERQFGAFTAPNPSILAGEQA